MESIISLLLDMYAWYEEYSIIHDTGLSTIDSETRQATEFCRELRKVFRAMSLEPYLTREGEYVLRSLDRKEV